MQSLHYTAPISDAPSATRRPSSAVWPMSACPGDKATLVAPATLRDFVSGVGARYGVALTGSHRSLRTRWHTLCDGRPKRGCVLAKVNMPWHRMVLTAVLALSA